MLRPLEQFICDHCGNLILTPRDGYLQWLRTDDGSREVKHSFHIVHGPQVRRGVCMYNRRTPGVQDSELSWFLGIEGLLNLYAFLDSGPYHAPHYSGPAVKDLREFVELMRRLTIPHYEEARLYWKVALAEGYFTGLNEVSIYHPNTLRDLIDRYEGCM